MAIQARKQQNQKAKTQFVLIDAALQANNAEVLKAFNKITASATALLTKWDNFKYRTHVIVDHAKLETNGNLIMEYVCYFFNITLSNSKEGKSYIFISLDEDSIERFGNTMMNMLLREAYRITNSEDNTAGIEYALKVQFMPADIHNFFYKRIVEGEQEGIVIMTEDKIVN